MSDIATHVPSKEALSLIPAELAVKRCCIPLQITDGTLLIAVNDPEDYQLADELRLLLYTSQTNKCIEPVFCMAEKDDIQQAIRENYGLGAATAERLTAQAENSDLQDERLEEDEDIINTGTNGEH